MRYTSSWAGEQIHLSHCANERRKLRNPLDHIRLNTCMEATHVHFKEAMPSTTIVATMAAASELE